MGLRTLSFFVYMASNNNSSLFFINFMRWERKTLLGSRWTEVWSRCHSQLVDVCVCWTTTTSCITSRVTCSNIVTCFSAGPALYSTHFWGTRQKYMYYYFLFPIYFYIFGVLGRENGEVYLPPAAYSDEEEKKQRPVFISFRSTHTPEKINTGLLIIILLFFFLSYTIEIYLGIRRRNSAVSPPEMRTEIDVPPVDAYR